MDYKKWSTWKPDPEDEDSEDEKPPEEVKHEGNYQDSYPR